ncbi:MAG: glycine cleavage system aminomethyltransferase GcvT [Phycisphaeraceae bacterium]|nr:glycine cleavage system aminomethyltransferase GcvT [Phycisphaeraceae bacterium]MCB9848014.1 glycine cleavage system aminomethyltransferase GcvT [Phycisphaeraceae bacterium]
MSPTETMLKKTPMHDWHVAAGAKMVDFAGWSMPLLYTSIIEEHVNVRTNVGMFDVSHMGRIRFEGADAGALLDRCCSRRVDNTPIGAARYGIVCNEMGCALDDVLIYRIDDEEFLAVVNASNREKLLAHFNEVGAEDRCTIRDETFETAMVAMQGPEAMELIGAFSSQVPALKRFRFTTVEVFGARVLVSRTGYTGEDGVEAIMPAAMATSAAELLSAMPGSDAIKPAGLGARDTLRLEAGMPLYGHELEEDIPAYAVGMPFAFSLGDPERRPFIGQAALESQKADGTPRKLIGLNIEGRRAARQGMAVTSGGAEVGVVTSGCLSPTLDRSIAMAYVDSARCAEGAAFEVQTGRAALNATACGIPFYKV